MRRMALTMGGLADAGTAGHDQHFGHQGEPDRGYLAFGKGKPDSFLDPWQCLVWIDPGPRQQRPARRPHQPVGDRALRPMQTCQKHTGRFANTVAMTEPSVSSRSSAVAVAACPYPQNAETVLLIVVRGALDESRQHFRGGWVWLRFHSNCRVIRFASPDAQSHSSASATPWCITTRAFHRQPARSSPAIGSSAHSLT